MKNILHILLLTMMIGCWSCGSGGEDVPTPTPKPEEKPKIEITTTAPVLEQAGGTASVTFTSTADWTIDVTEGRTVSWCSISPTSGGKGTNTLTITTSGNDTYDERNAKVTIKAGATSQSFTVTQKQKDGLTVTSNKVEIGSDGGDFSIEAKANVSVSYEIEESAKDWISASESRGLTTKTLNFTAKANDKVERRQGNIILKGGDGLTETVTVYQEGEKPTLVITSDDIIVGSDGETIKIELKSNVDYTMTMPEVDWINQDDSRAISAYTHYLTVAPNESYDQRSAMVYIQNEAEGLKDSINITQLQKDAIIVAKNEYEIAAEGGQLNFSVNTNVDFEVSVSVDWIHQNTGSRGLVEKPLSFIVAENDSTKSREGDIVITYQDLKQIVKVIQEGKIDYSAIDRAVLIEFYKATNGDNWTNNENWCSDKPLDKWSGVSVNKDGHVERLNIRHRNIQGAIPECIGKLIELKYLDMYDNGVVGPLPDSLAYCKNLEFLQLANNPLTGAVIPECWGQHMERLETLNIYNTELGGKLPKSIGGMKSLKTLSLAANNISGSIPENIGNLTLLEELFLSNNELIGSIPESMANLSNLKDLTLHTNQFNGSIPKAFQETESWKNFWPDILDNNEFDISNVKLYGPSFKNVKTLDGQIISDDIYTKNKLTILCTWLEWGGTEYLDALKEMYAKYKDMGLEIICYSKERDINVIKDFMQKNSIEWTTFSVEENKDKFLLQNTFYPFANIIAPNGEIINTSVYSFIEHHFQNDLFIELEYDKYESTDYSKDGEVKKLQTATKGKGIDVILMGDAFTDRLIADGTYDKVMNTAMEKFFVEEPYKSFRDHFNVYSVTAVSKHDIYGEKYGSKYNIYSNSALDCWFGRGTHVGGDEDKVLAYADKTGVQLLKSTIIIIMNSPEYAGTCYMSEPFPGETGDWGPGYSISFFPIGEDEEALEQVLNHEACGHGFAKLADEYAYQDYGTIPSDEKEKRSNTVKFGWWKNVDFTDNLTHVKWNHFLKDNRYDNEGLGAYEGGFTYWTGVWRATENSIMRHNTGGFNAPSREAIYYRIHKLAYGADWQYDYEKFVEYDAINRKSSASRSPNYVEMPKDFKPLYAPVIKRLPEKYGK